MTKKILQLVFILSIGFPVLFLLILSLGKQWVFPDLLPKELSFLNWKTLQNTETDFLTLFFRSVFISISVAFAVTFASFIISKSIYYSKYKTVYIILAYVPYLLSPIIMAILFHYFFIIANLTSSVFGVLIAQFLVSFPFGIIIFFGFWNQNIKSIELLSYNLGSSTKQTFIKILLPISKNILILCFFQIFLISWFEFGLTNLIGNGKVRTLTISVFNFINQANLFLAAFASVLLIIPPMVLVYVNKKVLFFIEKTSE